MRAVADSTLLAALQRVNVTRFGGLAWALAARAFARRSRRRRHDRARNLAQQRVHRRDGGGNPGASPTFTGYQAATRQVLSRAMDVRLEYLKYIGLRRTFGRQPKPKGVLL